MFYASYYEHSLFLDELKFAGCEVPKKTQIIHSKLKIKPLNKKVFLNLSQTAVAYVYDSVFLLWLPSWVSSLLFNVKAWMRANARANAGKECFKVLSSMQEEEKLKCPTVLALGG